MNLLNHPAIARDAVMQTSPIEETAF